MKKLALYFALCLSVGTLQAQSGEFTVYENGLIYSDTTMRQLEYIVDSLNLKFMKCELDKTYLAKKQARAHFVHLEKGDLKEAKKDMKNGMSFGDFKRKYPAMESDRYVLVVRYSYLDYDDKEVIEFSTVVADYSINPDNQGDLIDLKKGAWVFEHSKKTNYSKERVTAFFLITDLEAAPLAEPYARMVQYSNCLVDTTTAVFKEDAEYSGVRFDNNQPSKVKAFWDYVDRETKKPELDCDETDSWEKFRQWDSLKFALIEEDLSKRKEFIVLLNAAVDEALEKGGSDDHFEILVGRYYSKEAELELKRSRIVVGGCSMDWSPRYHAIDIAKLSAETVKWEVFLRAHLDVMNDNFQRVSDGSWAWAGRKTYIKELEELEINVHDLLLGISLRIENPSKNHYYGSISRVGRALSETKDQLEIKEAMLAMIKDDELDDHNRALMVGLYLNYNSNLEDEAVKKQNDEALALAMEELPEYIEERIKKVIED